MKNIYLIAVLLATVCGFYACSDEHNPVYIPDNEKSAQITYPASETEYVLEIENKYNLFDSIKWSKTEYSLLPGIRYTLTIDKEDGDFENAITLTSSTQSAIGLTVEEMNLALEKLLLVPNQKSKIKLRLQSDAYGGEEGNVRLEQFPTLYSEAVELYVTPYEEAREYPGNLYMIGGEFGNWDWEDPGIVEMVPVNNRPGEFWCVNYFTSGSGFKWAPKKAWANDFSSLGENTGFIQNGGNAEVQTDGLYMVYIDMKNDKICIEPALIYGIGDCFGSWDEGAALFTISGQTTSYVTTGGGELRMYAGSSIATTAWWTREFIILGGKIEYRGNDNDQERVNVEAGKVITLDFKAGVGSIN